MQETSQRRAHRWNVMSEQRKSDWQHPNSYYRKREETEHAATDECDTSRHPQPFRTIPTKAVQVMADPCRDVIREALHFLVEIRNPRHRFIPMVARRSTTAWEILWSRPTEVLDGHCVPFARPKYRRQPLGPPIALLTLPTGVAFPVALAAVTLPLFPHPAGGGLTRLPAGLRS